MAQVSIERDPGTPAKGSKALAREWDPFRAMREFFRWDPLAEFSPRLRALEEANFAPDFDVKETKDAFVFTADVPGVKEGDLDIRLTQNRLSVSGKRESEKEETGETYYASERSYGTFTRAFTLPEGVDAENIKAELTGGVLTLELPKKPESQPKKIDVASK